MNDGDQNPPPPRQSGMPPELLRQLQAQFPAPHQPPHNHSSTTQASTSTAKYFTSSTSSTTTPISKTTTIPPLATEQQTTTPTTTTPVHLTLTPLPPLMPPLPPLLPQPQKPPPLLPNHTSTTTAPRLRREQCRPSPGIFRNGRFTRGRHPHLQPPPTTNSTSNPTNPTTTTAMNDTSPTHITRAQRMSQLRMARRKRFTRRQRQPNLQTMIPTLTPTTYETIPITPHHAVTTPNPRSNNETPTEQTKTNRDGEQWIGPALDLTPSPSSPMTPLHGHHYYHSSPSPQLFDMSPTLSPTLSPLSPSMNY